MNNYQDFVEAVAAMEENFTKFYDKGVKSAGPRLRKQFQEIAKMCKEGRAAVTETANARKAEKGSE